ncbi:hypothetical protein ON010_g7032 [Phytophthora cinnamomi]|nr:hypothetical protein ON010_g7032 [Phytophthora cinnamomi]
MELPTLGSILSFLGDLYSKYEELDDSNELCKSLHERLKRFLDMLSTIDPATIEANGLLSSISKLVNEFSAAVTEYADQDFVSRWLRPNTFPEKVKLYNERLDELCRMGVKEAANLLEWRNKYEQDMSNALSSTHGLREKIWKALDDDKKWPPSKIEEMMLSVKRDLPESPVSMRHKRHQQILEVAEEHFLSGKKLEKPPSWLIAANELSSHTEAIANSEFAEIVVRKWQGAQVAVKKMVIAVDTNPVFDKQFIVWSTLRHPNVAQLYGAGTDCGAPFFVYEYASKRSLDCCWDQMTPKEVWGILLQASLGLLYLHSRKIVHGNLSCSKILINDHGHVKLFEFGASYVRDNNQSNSASPRKREEFAAPECIGIGADGKADGIHSPGFEADVYTFGLTIMEAIGKKSPFEGMELSDIHKVKERNELQRPENMNEEAWRLVQRMCERNPNERVSLALVVYELEKLAQ